MNEVHTLDAIRSFLHWKKRHIEDQLSESHVWSEDWSEAWGAKLVIDHLQEILDTGTWDGNLDFSTQKRDVV